MCGGVWRRTAAPRREWRGSDLPLQLVLLMGNKLKESKELKCRDVAEAAPEALTVVWTTEGRWPPVVACL